MCRLAEGRQPWTLKTSPQPERELTDAESGIWALAGPPTPGGPGGLILAGTEDGTVLAWDVRSPALAWQVCPQLFTLTGLIIVAVTVTDALTSTVAAACSLSIAAGAVLPCDLADTGLVLFYPDNRLPAMVTAQKCLVGTVNESHLHRHAAEQG